MPRDRIGRQIVVLRTDSAVACFYSTTMYVLHYAPDNASLIVRLALETVGAPYQIALVDRAAEAQRSPEYRALNPHGLIPVLETPEGPLFETAAILIWLTDTHGVLGPQHGDLHRGAWLKWMLHVANTLHPALRQTFYAHKYIGDDPSLQNALRRGLQPRIRDSLLALDAEAQRGTAFSDTPGALDFYVAACLRWRALYPAATDRSWFDMSEVPALAAICARVEGLRACRTLINAEGSGMNPFTAPMPPQPPEGSAL